MKNQWINLEKSEKDTLIQSLKQDLKVELDYNKDNVSSSALKLSEKLPTLDKFPQDIAEQVKSEVSQKESISLELGNKVFSELDKIQYFTFSIKCPILSNI